MTLNWKKLQDKWQKKWQKAELGKAVVNKNKEKFMIIFAYPGISGYPHVGHLRGYSYTDMIARYKRLKGKEVLFPVGTHASGNQALAFANKVKNKDKNWINYLLNNGCPEKKLPELTNPHKIIAYFNEVFVNDYFKKFGFLCDWERFTCTTYPDYEKFIYWQFQKLMQNNLLVQKPYFAPFSEESGPVAVDPSETDLSKGGNAERLEYTLLKFKWKNAYLVAATLRPETVFGQTNLWINPTTTYLQVKVDGETWIISKEAAEKLRYQKDNVMLGKTIESKTLIGQKVLAPGLNKEILILPASFCDSHVGTGIVTCVPGDAPYDYVALKLLQNNPEKLAEFNLDPDKIKAISLIPIINTRGYGKFPAAEIVEKLGITSLEDPKLEEVTKEIYKTGYHTGVMKENARQYAGLKVEEAKERIKAELLEQGKADVLFDLSEEVICRNGGKVFIKKIDDQWFIRYSDQELTFKSKEQVKKMLIFPDEYKENLPQVLDWFSDRACARLGNWLGSKLPFDDKWTIEPISDSTLYPAYYLVSKFINQKKLKTEDLTEEFFDYVFLKKEASRDLLEDKKQIWQEVREEFNYFYPLDLNLGGKEHKTVHFPVFLMNHVAILPAEKWPKGIFVNWWVTGKGSKISKSKGGAEPIPQALEKYGVDAMRLYYAHIGSPHVDVVWTEEVVLNYQNTLEKIYFLVEELKSLEGGRNKIDFWLESRIQDYLQKVSKALENYNFREFSSLIYYSLVEDLKWYKKRGGQNQKTISEILKIWTILMNPITPHLSEELNSTSKLVSSSSWPKEEPDKINLSIEAGEELVKKTRENMREVLKFVNLAQPTKYTLFIAKSWLYDLFTIVGREINVTRNAGEIIRKVLEHPELKPKGKEISKLVTSLLKDVSKIPPLVTYQEAELETLKDAKEFLEKEFCAKVEIVLAEDSNHPKAESAMPGKVGILVE